MQTAEDFMRDYLTAMVNLQESSAEAFLPIHHHFFMEGYKPFDPMKNVAMAKSEIVISVAKKDDSTEVITTGYGEHHRLRYSLASNSGSFLISQMEMECGLCSRRGNPRPECKFCGGRGWQSLPLKPREPQ